MIVSLITTAAALLAFAFFFYREPGTSRVKPFAIAWRPARSARVSGSERPRAPGRTEHPM